ncbi:MAG: response regulator [Lentisphaerae bacterium]|nr:response regulator [Lentisphaerota bacterium]
MPDNKADSATPQMATRRPTAVPTIKKKPPADEASGYRNLLESIYDGVLIADQGGAIIDGNSRALHMFSSERSVLCRSNITDWIHGADAALVAKIRVNISNRKYTLIETYCNRSDQTLFPVEIAVNEIDLAGQKMMCFFIRDISTRKHTEQKLREYDQHRTQFISNVSHELRVPLTSMIYAITNMLNGVAGELSPEGVRYLRSLEAGGKRMLMTINGILDMTGLENNMLSLNKKKVPLASFVRSSLILLALRAEQQEITFKENISNCSSFVECDPEKMERVLMNIADNAIKFTPPGGTVEVTAQAASDGQGLITVEDNGIGIPSADLPRVSTRYFRGGTHAHGSGLGLSISKEIVELHQGRLTIESPPAGKEKGTRVTIALPAAASPLVLIVDDNEEIRKMLTTILQASGYRTLTASSAEEALLSLSNNPVELIILDLLLPTLNGFQLANILRQNTAWHSLPVIAITGMSIESEQKHILDQYNVPLLSKPFRKEELTDRIEKIFLPTGE